MSPGDLLRRDNILHKWELTEAELSQIIEQNPSLRGMMFGYVSEFKVRKTWFEREEFSEVKKPDDHDRSKKGDLSVVYKNKEIRIEVKGLQTDSVRNTEGDSWAGNFQCDASDRRNVILPNGEELQTTCLQVGEFDLLAVSLFQFGDRWRFAFAKNTELPRSTYRGYDPQKVQPYLLKTSMKITWPLSPPYYSEPFTLLDQIVAEK
ncbi:MAG: restriction endonuclease [Cyanobacteria bacterium MAG STY4_bin_9]|nr:restriction endonuclease [Cyanobacteria bacterium MAG STY4_bin_9]